MKKIFFPFIIIIILITLIGCGNKSVSNTANENNVSTTTNETNTERVSYSVPSPEPLSEFTTTIYDADDERQTNMTLACNTLSGTVVKASEIFSFNEILGPAKPEDGYEKAEVFESDR